MKEIYVIAKFKLNNLDLKDEWVKMSSGITEHMMENEKGLIFRDSTMDEDGNVKCILKWESEEAQETADKNFKIMCEEQPEIMEDFSKIADMSTMTKEILPVI